MKKKFCLTKKEIKLLNVPMDSICCECPNNECGICIDESKSCAVLKCRKIIAKLEKLFELFKLEN
jgi:hypothetical protein